jgi:acetyl-CoA acetyltransferase
VIELNVRRLVSSNTACPQGTFRQQVPQPALGYARRTPWLSDGAAALVLMGAGEAVRRGLEPLGAYRGIAVAPSWLPGAGRLVDQCVALNGWSGSEDL